MNVQIGRLRSVTSPFFRSGVIVNFDVRESHDAIIHVVLPDGSPVRQGAIARLMGRTEYAPIGTDGRLYLRGIEEPSQVTIRWNGTICDIIVPKPEGNKIISDLGEFVCEPREFR